MKPRFMRKSPIYIFSRKHINGNNAVKVDRRMKNKNVPDRLFCKIPQKEQKYKQVGKKFQIKHTQVRVQTSLSWNDLKPDESISEGVVQRGVRAENKKKKEKKENCSNRETGLAVCWWKTNRRRKRSPNKKSNHSLASVGITPLMWHTWNAWAVIELVKQKKKEKRLKTKVFSLFFCGKFHTTYCENESTLLKIVVLERTAVFEGCTTSQRRGGV